MTRFGNPKIFALLASTALATTPALAQDAYSPNLDAEIPMNVYWGDTHQHTNLSSLDASDSGRLNVGAEEAYRFARGEIIENNQGLPVQLTRPLDFLVIADHAEFMGLWEAVKAGDEVLMKTEWGKRWREQYLQAQGYDDLSALDKEMLTPSIPLIERDSPPLNHKEFRQGVWQRVGDLADTYNDPGKFTTLIGFEWSVTPNWANLHRVVIFRDDASKTNQVIPLSAPETSDPEELWAYLANYEKSTGGEVLAIPHNSNLSLGLMFNDKRADGSPIDAFYAEQRSRWEPLLEVTQLKGDSETHPILSPNDEFADYETWNSWLGTRNPEEWTDELLEQKKGEYARSGLRMGLAIQDNLGVNPFKYGMIGSTDSHQSISAVEENNFWGKFYQNAPNPDRLLKPAYITYKTTSTFLTWELAASGYAAVWAKENTREALFDAMKRRETYASTGPRINLRFFGGWDFEKDDAHRPDLAHLGYDKGVPMGSDLTAAPAQKSPNFLIRAVKDPEGANLDRVQVVKGWLGDDGETHEKIYDVALSDQRKPKKNGKAKPVGSTVNVEEATYTNTIGDPELSVVWTDPDFKEDQLAFYYVRVLEIPTPRWPAYDVAAFGLTDLPEEIPLIHQERAYSSPIWYTPAPTN